ncbi:hypothetical protein D3C85_1687980 [compost metagenome]
MMITPPPALDPYNAEAAAPLRTVILSILLGSKSLIPFPESYDLVEVATPLLPVPVEVLLIGDPSTI